MDKVKIIEWLNEVINFNSDRVYYLTQNEIVSSNAIGATELAKAIIEEIENGKFDKPPCFIPQCPYCKDINSMSVGKVAVHMFNNMFADFYIDEKANYCPQCGRDLKGGKHE